jgi:hypothetical protein
MKSLESLLAEAVGKMTPDQRQKFIAAKTTGMPIEGILNLAESICGETSVRESRAIRRNNGGQRVEESGDFSMEKADEILFEGLRKARPQAWTEVKESPEASGLTESQRKDYDFCRLLGMSEADSLRSVKADIRD